MKSLGTVRIELRPIGMKDLQAVHDLHSLPETDAFNTLGIPANIAETEGILRNWVQQNEANPQQSFTWGLFLRKTNAFFGLIALNLGNPKYQKGEVWFKLHKDYWKQGFASEALAAVLKFAFHDLQLHRVEAGCAVENVGSIRVLEKSGMKREGRKRQNLPLSSGWSDNFEYGLLAEEYAEGD